MKASLSMLLNDAAIAETFFARKEQVACLPFVHSFPKNSCEVTAAFFATAIARKYSQSRVVVAMAYSHPRNEWHFWIEIDSVVVDITAHQFPEYHRPLVCAKPSPLEFQFSDVDRLQPQAALARLNSISPEIQQSVLSALEKEVSA